MRHEAQFRKQVDAFLRMLPNTISMSIQQVAIRGTPDKLLCCNGRFVALEIKAVDGKPSPLQKHTLEKIRGAGGIGLLVYPEKWDVVQEMLLRLAGG